MTTSPTIKTKHSSRKCSGACTSARSAGCTCECDGRNHGDTTDPTRKPETPNLMAALRASLDEAKVQREARNDPAGLVRAVLSVGDPERAVVISRPTLTAAADEIESLRAQLAAVTERAEQLRMALTDLCDRVQRDNYGREAVDVFDIREALREPGEPR